MKISVLTPTIRKDRLAIVEKALRKQTCEDFEWLIGSKFDPKIPWATWIKDDFEDGYWSLNRIYNRLIKNTHGQLLVSWQDSVYAPPESLSAFWEDFQATEEVGCLTAYGDQYSKIDKFGRPYNKVWSDPRKSNKTSDSFYEITFYDLEWNLCAVPKKILLEVGGFCEKLDETGFGMDGYQVNERINTLGYRFYANKTIESYTFRHDRSSYGGGEKWNKDNNLHNGQYEAIRKEFIEKDEWPIMKYLSIDK